MSKMKELFIQEMEAKINLSPDDSDREYFEKVNYLFNNKTNTKCQLTQQAQGELKESQSQQVTTSQDVTK